MKLLRERRAKILQQQAELQVRDDEGSGQQLESEDTLHCGRLDVLCSEGVTTICLERAFDFQEHLDQKRAGAAARVKDEHVGVGKAIRYVELVAQRDHVTDDFRRGKPDAQPLPQHWVIGSKERLIEILHRMVFFEV